MITYCFLHPEDGILERAFPMGQAPAFLEFEDGCIAPRNYQAEAVGGIVKGTDNPVIPKRKIWPMEPCYASGVHASQAPKLREHFKKHGLSVQVNNDGNPIYESASQRKKALKSRGMYDKASF